MNKYNAIIIGFGKGGKTLAGELSNKGYNVALIEENKNMYGGTCINIGCIPTKSLVHQAKLNEYKNIISFSEKEVEYKNAIENKEKLIGLLRQKNYDNLNNRDNITIFNGKASFISNTQIKIEGEDEQIIEGEKIFINTGAKTIIPNIEGINESKHVYTSTTIMKLDKLPKTLTIIGGGYIGLEFASIYSNFGTKVTVIEGSDRIMPREDKDIVEIVKARLESKGISFILNSKVKSIKDNDNKTIVSYIDTVSNKEINIDSDAVLVAVGRKANTDGLNLDAAGVNVNERGEVIVDEKLKTNVENIWALGDVKGGLQFTYISLDDYRIIKDDLFGEGKRSLKDRLNVPYSVFLDPPFSRVGLTEESAIKEGYEVKVAKLPCAAIPRARVINEIDGIMKAVVDVRTNKILGVSLFCAESSEIINTVHIAMKTGQEYTFLRDNIFTHPTMSEALNDLFSSIN